MTFLPFLQLLSLVFSGLKLGCTISFELHLGTARLSPKVQLTATFEILASVVVRTSSSKLSNHSTSAFINKPCFSIVSPSMFSPIGWTGSVEATVLVSLLPSPDKENIQHPILSSLCILHLPDIIQESLTGHFHEQGQSVFQTTVNISIICIDIFNLDCHIAILGILLQVINFLNICIYFKLPIESCCFFQLPLEQLSQDTPPQQPLLLLLLH